MTWRKLERAEGQGTGGYTPAGSVWYAQKIKMGYTGPNMTHVIGSLSLWLNAVGTPPGYFYVYLKGSSMTGGALSTGSGAGNFFDGVNWTNDTIKMSSYTMQPDTEYSLVFSQPDASTEGGNADTVGLMCDFGHDYSGTDYALYRSYDYGANWSLVSTGYWDIGFRLYGSGASPTTQGYLKMHDGLNNLKLPFISTSDGDTYNSDSTFRIEKGGTTYCADVVSTGDSEASNVRVVTANGTKAWRSGA